MLFPFTKKLQSTPLQGADEQDKNEVLQSQSGEAVFHAAFFPAQLGRRFMYKRAARKRQAPNPLRAS
jgi:hypothetical protein